MSILTTLSSSPFKFVSVVPADTAFALVIAACTSRCESREVTCLHSLIVSLYSLALIRASEYRETNSGTVCTESHGCENVR